MTTKNYFIILYLLLFSFIAILLYVFNNIPINNNNILYKHKIDSIEKINDSLVYVNKKILTDIISKKNFDSIILYKIKYIESKKYDFRVISLDSNIIFLKRFL